MENRWIEKKICVSCGYLLVKVRLRIFEKNKHLRRIFYRRWNIKNNEFVYPSYFSYSYIVRMLTTHIDLHKKGKIIGISKTLSYSLRSVKTMRLWVEENSGC